MPQVTLLSRQSLVRFPAPGVADEVAAVAYVTAAHGPRVVYLPLASYRPATDAELKTNPRYTLIPRDPKAIDAEKLSIQQDLAQAQAIRPQTFPLP